ncbi:hypothetical protein [Microvirga massiliensis]|uniref:hypothetical protein n=1 Tax=Microvirga massiliensis TaxID=1033741 RepID=UPI0006602E7E|nr:hypothetical protein [Microvirga massiliensis]
MHVRPNMILAAGLVGALASACAPASPLPAASSAPTGVTPSNFRLPEGAGCTGEIARYRAVMANDLATGHVNRSVHDRVAREIERAEETCAAGQDSEAVRMISATKSRYGYR